MTPTGAARVAGVMGWPVAHSRSPRLHGYWLDHHGIDGVYAPFAVAPGDLARALDALPALGPAGVNPPLPHKEAALGRMARLSETARRIGAVNTVVVAEDGSLTGDNTDAFGFIENLRSGAPGWRAEAGPAVVLGAGGAARAVAVALQDAGAPEIRIVNRTRTRAEKLAIDLGAPLVARSWDGLAQTLADARLLVNATRLGMAGGPALGVDLAPLPAEAVVNDIVYVPRVTELLAAAAARGLVAVDGLGMLLHQARPGFRAWFGVDPEVTPELRAFVGRDLDA